MMVPMGMPAAREYDAEATVIEAIRSGDRYAFEEFVRRNNRWVRGVVFGVLGNRDIGDDVCQQVWASFWQRVGKLRDPASWRPWLYRLAHNAAIDAGRELSRKKTGALTPELEAVRPAGNAPVEAETMQSEEHRAVMDAVAALPAIYREPFVLRHLNGWSYREIGELMGLPVDSVETRLVRARRFLKEALKNKL